MDNNTLISTHVYHGLMNALFVVLFILKLTNTIDWSWWYVTMPLWINIVVTICCLFIELMLIIVVVNTCLLYNNIKQLFRR